MSFLNDILGSIGTGQSPAPPRPVQKLASTPANVNTETRKHVPRPNTVASSSYENSTKRKADDELRKPTDKSLKKASIPNSSNNPTSALPSAALPTPAENIANGKIAVSSTKGVQAPAGPPKAPPKGSFADIMARARAAQEQKGQNQVGVIKHQAVSKEKVSKTAMRRREEEAKTKDRTGNHGRRGEEKGMTEKRRSASPAKKSEVSRASNPAAPPSSAYRGTMGLSSRDRASKLNASGRKPSRSDSYLDTDEDENDDDDEGTGMEVDDDEEEEHDSNASSDMEAGAFDIDLEEKKALQQAKEDDAKELALEKRLKQEKEERRKRLQALVDKKR